MNFLLGENGAKDKEDGVPVDTTAVDLCWRQSHSNPAVKACLAYINSRLLGPGFMFLSVAGREPSDAFTRHVNEHIVPFAKKALEHILVQGFCVYGVKPHFERSAWPVPFLYSRGAYEVRMIVERGEDKIKVVGAGKGKKGKFFILVDDLPDSDGSIKSRVAGVSKIVSYLEEIENLDIQAFAIRSRPPVLTKSTTDHMFDSRDVIGGAVDGLAAQKATNNMETRNMINVDQFKQQEDLIRTLNRERIDSTEGLWPEHLDASKNTFLSKTLQKQVEGFVPRLIPLPNDVDVAKFELPLERKDYVQLQKFCKTQICTGLGVPEAYIDGQPSGSSKSEGSLKTMDEFVRISLMPLREAISKILLAVYGLCLGDPGEVECIFPGSQNVDKMLMWYEHGILKRKALIRAISLTENIKMDDFISDDEGPSKETPPRVARGRDVVEASEKAESTDEEDVDEEDVDDEDKGKQNDSGRRSPRQFKKARRGFRGSKYSKGFS